MSMMCWCGKKWDHPMNNDPDLRYRHHGPGFVNDEWAEFVRLVAHTSNDPHLVREAERLMETRR
jgi:hypothetical protein